MSPAFLLALAAAFLLPHTQEMENRFLQGLDPGIDYAAIDADTRLDEHFAAQITRDAEDAYFRESVEHEVEGGEGEVRREEYDY